MRNWRISDIMNKIIRCICATLVFIVAFSSLAVSAHSIGLRGDAGSEQLYLRYAKVSVFAENGQIIASSSQADKKVLVENAKGGLFYTKSHVIAFGKTPDSHEDTWLSYDVNNGQIDYNIIPSLSNPFWGDDSGLYYSDYANKANIFRFNPNTNKTKKLLSSIEGKPFGYVDKKLICLDSSKNRVISYDAKKKMSVLFSTEENILDCKVINQKIYISHSDAFYRLDGAKLTKLYDKYAPIVLVSEPYFINVMSTESKNALQGKLSLHLNNATNNTQAQISAGINISASKILGSPGISADGKNLTFERESFALPDYSDFSPYSKVD